MDDFVAREEGTIEADFEPIGLLLSVTPYGVVKDQKYHSAHCCHHNAIQIQPRDTDVAEHMEDPSAYDGAHHA